MKIDAIEEGARQAREVLRALARRAAARLDGRAAAATGIGGGDELKARRERGAPRGARHDDVALLERLAQGLEDSPRELGQLVQKWRPMLR